MVDAKSSWGRVGVAAAVFVGIGLAVLAAERLIAARDPDLLWRDPATGDDGLKFYRFDPVLGLFHKPSFSATYRGVRYTANRLGVRGPEIDHARTPGRARVVLLGDSVVWGFGVPDGETLADELARAWARSGSDVEVVNLGVAGYGTGQEWMLLREEGLRYRPDLVLLVFTIANDVEDTYYPDSADAYPANLFHLDDGGELVVDRFETSPLERLGLRLSHESYLVRALADAATSRDAGRDDGERAASGRDGTRVAPARSAVGRANRERLLAHAPELQRYADLRFLAPPDGAVAPRYAKRGGWLRPDALGHYKVELVEALLARIARTSRDAGARFAVVLAPYAAELAAGAPPNPLTVELARFLAAEGIEFVDLAPLLAATGAAKDALYVDAVHFSVEGNRVVAQLVAAAVPAPAPDGGGTRADRREGSRDAP